MQNPPETIAVWRRRFGATEGFDGDTTTICLLQSPAVTIMRFVSGVCSRCVSMLAVAVLVPVSVRSASPDSDPLPSWNESAAKRAIVEFVGRVTDAGSPDHVPAAERVAVFDNDGTLWPECPLPFQAAFAVDRAMLQYTTVGNPRLALGVIVHHTDADREYAYDAQPQGTGRLVEAIAEASRRGWTVVDMKRDWVTIFAPDSPAP
jgi:hypothetical protein